MRVHVVAGDTKLGCELARGQESIPTAPSVAIVEMVEEAVELVLDPREPVGTWAAGRDGRAL